MILSIILALWPDTAVITYANGDTVEITVQDCQRLKADWERSEVVWPKVECR